jgi:diguanylate cyclase (GGDEF)-like protein
MPISCRILYTLGGATTSIVVPAGLLLLRLLSGVPSSLQDELIRNGLTYAYVSIASAVAVTAFGYAIGCRADALRKLATTDPLTNLFNRRAIEGHMRFEWERARRYALPLSLLMIDLDGFKRINDEGGHSAGDRVLRGTATAITSALRASDYGARWGGDEFMILAPHTTRQAAIQLAERISRRISQHGGNEALAPTASIGVVTLEHGALGDAEVSHLVDQADRALYAAKDGSRGGVVSH